MTNNRDENNSLKKVNSLLSLKFYIPSYQRGYRWTKFQVKDLLNDINDFKMSGDKWYCLQPVVVKKDSKNNRYELIDGQQRITTIALIIHYFNQKWRGEEKLDEPALEFETRSDCNNFIKNIKINKDTKKITSSEPIDKNIDYYHIAQAYSEINEWAMAQKAIGDFNDSDFQSKFLHYSKVIWYEVDENTDGRIPFSRINMGKIPLTNSELIKALFLNSSNFIREGDDGKSVYNGYKEDSIFAKQIEIANDWDNIENQLHRSDFWYFINQNTKKCNKSDTRIEFLFDMLCDYEKEEGDDYALFRKYYERFNEYTEQKIISEWKQIKTLYEVLKCWFEDRVLYHKIGFLVTIGKSIKEIYNDSRTKTKKDFLLYLDKEIKEYYKDIGDLADLEYSSKETRNILLLHNIQTMLNNKNETTKFPFDRYKEEKWDIEHIHAVNTELPKEAKSQIDWLNEHKSFLEDNSDRILKNRVDEMLANNDFKDFNKLAIDILDYFSESKKNSNVNTISNLVLLDQGTNRGYKNYAFIVKRKWIINKEKAGTFIPICTKNVFMKLYNTDVKQMTLWGTEDQEYYLENLKDVLSPYFS